MDRTYPVSGMQLPVNWMTGDLVCVRAERLSAGDGLCDADLYPGDYSGAVDALFVMVLLWAWWKALTGVTAGVMVPGMKSSLCITTPSVFVKPAFLFRMIYLSWPSAIYPNLVLLLPALFGLAVAVAASFKNIYRRWAETHNTCFVCLCQQTSGQAARQWCG